MGMTDTFKGTGVFSAIEFQREDEEGKNEAPKQQTADQKEETPAPKK
jgi:hypothetical protein